MIKKILFLALIMLMFISKTFAQEVFKVTSVNFDTSSSMLFLTSPDNTSEPILKAIKLIKLQNPNRAYFDIENAILTTPQQNWFFNAGSMKQIKVGQFSTEPNKIRVVMYFDEGFNPSKLEFLKINNNIIVKFKNGICKNIYFQNTYRDERSSSADFYENLTISDSELPKFKPEPKTEAENEQLYTIQQAFNTASAAAPEKEIFKKDLKLKSKYYLNNISITNGVLINGFGSITLEKPMYLSNPSRVVYDIPNTIVEQELRNKDFKINATDSVKVGQFESNKARIVITSPETEKYIPIFSQDNQSLLFSSSIKLDTLVSKTSDAIGYYHNSSNELTNEFIMAFSTPIVHSIKRDNSKLTINLCNVSRYSESSLRKTLAGTAMDDMKIELMPKIGLKLTLPLRANSIVNCYMGSDARSLKINVKAPKPSAIPVVPVIVKKKGSGKTFGKVVVIDAGHGGSDYGAIRNNFNEKDINLDVAKRVEAILLSKGVSVEMVRSKDEAVSLQDRVLFSNNKSADVFVSVHVNASTKPEITGIETHYYRSESMDLAQSVHAQLASNIKSKDRGLFRSKFYVINHTKAPAILVEIGFISNEDERNELLGNHRKQQTAKAIAEGILDYLSGMDKK